MNAEIVHEDGCLSATELLAEVIDVTAELFNVDRAVKTFIVQNSMLKGYRCNDSSCLDTNAFEVHLDVLVSVTKLPCVDRAYGEHDLVQVNDKRLVVELL